MVLFYCHIYLSPTNTVYTHPTSSGNKHIPSGGSAGQILRWSSDGTATWGNDNNTTYGTGTSSASGLTKLYGGTGSATDGTMTQSAITSALNGKVSDGTNNANLYGINIDKNGAYIYGDGTGNILFRYRQSKTADYSYMNLVSLISNANSYITHGGLNNGTDLNGVTECGGYMLAGSYSNSPVAYATLHVCGSSSYRSQFAINCFNEAFLRFRDEKGNWTNWAAVNTSTKFIETNFYNSQDIVYGVDSAAIRFTGSTPWGIVKNPNSLQVVNNGGAKFRFQDKYCYCDVNFNSAGIYTNTSSGSPNIYISEQGNVKRSTSASKYKLNIKPLEEDASYPYKLLKLEPKQWFDKGETERYAELLSKEYSGEEIDEEEELFAEDGSINSYYGLIAEDIEKAGLEKFCVYDKKNKEIEGIMYDRIPILMIPILKDIVTLLKEIVPLVKDSIKDKESLTKVSSIIDRMNSINDSTMVNTTYKVDTTEK